MGKCIHCGGPGVWRDYHVDDLCVCVTCCAMTEVEAAIRRQELEDADNGALLALSFLLPLPFLLPVGSFGVTEVDLTSRHDEGLGDSRRARRRAATAPALPSGPAFELEDDAEYGRTR